MTYELRPGTVADLPTYQRILYEAVGWHQGRVLPPMPEALADPQLVPYHRGWGRGGDIAVVATFGGNPVGGAFCRLFTAEDHGSGFVDDETPEIAIAVWPEHRGRGLGTRLLAALADAARSAGSARLSLSVERENPAVRAYLRAGYETVAVPGNDYVMVARLV